MNIITFKMIYVFKCIMRTKAAELIDKVDEFTELSISIEYKRISVRNNAADFQVFIGCRVSALLRWCFFPSSTAAWGSMWGWENRKEEEKKSQFF